MRPRVDFQSPAHSVVRTSCPWRTLERWQFFADSRPSERAERRHLALLAAHRRASDLIRYATRMASNRSNTVDSWFGTVHVSLDPAYARYRPRKKFRHAKRYYRALEQTVA